MTALISMCERVRDVVSNTFTETVNLTMNCLCFDGFPTTAGVTLDNGFGEYELPIVFAVPGATDLSPPPFYYIDGVTFTDADFVPAEPATAAFTYFVDGLLCCSTTTHCLQIPMHGISATDIQHHRRPRAYLCRPQCVQCLSDCLQ